MSDYILWFSLLWGCVIIAVSPWRIQNVRMSGHSLHFPLRHEHKLLMCVVVFSVVLAVGIPLASAPQKLTTVETQATTRMNPYLVTTVCYETRTVTSVYTYTYSTTSLYTTTLSVTMYITTVVYPQYPPRYGEVPAVTTVIPVQVQQTQVQSIILQQTRTVDGQQTITELRHSIVQKVSTAVETIMRTTTLPYSSAVIRSYSENFAWLAIAIILPILAYHRINAYRTRLHIYYEILNYTSYAPRLSSHIMRACNLETRKFERYIQTLAKKGFIEEIGQDGGKLYRTSRRGLDLIRDEKLTLFVKELP